MADLPSIVFACCVCYVIFNNLHSYNDLRCFSITILHCTAVPVKYLCLCLRWVTWCTPSSPPTGTPSCPPSSACCPTSPASCSPAGPGPTYSGASAYSTTCWNTQVATTTAAVCCGQCRGSGSEVGSETFCRIRSRIRNELFRIQIRAVLIRNGFETKISLITFTFSQPNAHLDK
jgi:hypothetical protein